MSRNWTAKPLVNQSEFESGIFKSDLSLTKVSEASPKSSKHSDT